MKLFGQKLKGVLSKPEKKNEYNKLVVMTVFQYLERTPIILSWLLCGSSILVEFEFGVMVFFGGRKTGEPIEKPSDQVGNQQKN